MVKKQDEKMYWILGVGLLIILIYGGNQGWFKNTFTIQQPPQTLTIPPEQSTTLNSCLDVCTTQDFETGYESSTCEVGETKVNYGYAGQPAILTCCCYNEEEDYEYSGCYDSDLSLSTIEDRIQFAGYCQDIDGVKLDECSWSGAVSEYYCEPTMSPPLEQTCGFTSFNCVGMLGEGAYCEDGECILPEEEIELTIGAYCVSLGFDRHWDTPISSNCPQAAINYCEPLGKNNDYFYDYEKEWCCYTCIEIDTDGDGYSDSDELSEGTNPNDSNSYPGGGPVEYCADNCKSIDYAGSYYMPGGTLNSCMGYAYDTCFPIHGLQYQASTYIVSGSCCCFDCEGW